jgi:hypothetical protein
MSVTTSSTARSSSRFIQQRAEALDNANATRVLRKRLRQDLCSGERRIEDVVREPEWFVSTARISDVLSWAPRIGCARVNTVLRRADVWPLRDAGRLTVNQRDRILEELGRLDEVRRLNRLKTGRGRVIPPVSSANFNDAEEAS